MKRITTIAAFMILGSAAQAQTAAIGQSASDAGAIASTGSITFEGSPYPDRQRVHTTPHIVNAPAMFGYSSNNCGASDTMALSITGFGIGGAKAGESIRCNTRQDVATAWNLGLQDVAILRFACFGEPENRMAWEASGRACPASATAQGIEGAPVGPKFAVASQVQETQRYRIQPDGSTVRVE